MNGDAILKPPEQCAPVGVQPWNAVRHERTASNSIKKVIRMVPLLIFSGILIGYIILLPPEAVFSKPITMLLPEEVVLCIAY